MSIYVEPKKLFNHEAWSIWTDTDQLNTSQQITFANNLDPNQARQSVGSDLDPNGLTL